MSCYICGRGACSPCFHSIEEQERFAPVQELLDKAYDLRDQIRHEIQEEELEAEQKEPEE